MKAIRPKIKIIFVNTKIGLDILLNYVKKYDKMFLLKLRPMGV